MTLTLPTSVETLPPPPTPNAWRDSLARLRQLARSEQPQEIRAREIGTVLALCPGVIAGAFLPCDDKNGVAATPALLVCRREFEHMAAPWRESLRRLASAAHQQNSDQLEHLRDEPASVTILAAPVARNLTAVGVIGLIVPYSAHALPLFQQVVRDACAVIAEGMISHQVGRDQVKHEAATTDAMATEEILRESSSHPTTWHAALLRAVREPSLGAGVQQIANQLARGLKAERVFVGLCRAKRGQCKLAAISDETPFDKRSAWVADCEEALAEALVRGQPVMVRAGDRSPHVTTAVREFMRACAADVFASGPLVGNDDKVFGAWAAIGSPTDGTCDNGALLSPRAVQEVREAGACLDLLRRSQPGWRQRTMRVLWHGEGRRRTLSIAATVLVVALGLFVPWPYQVRCGCEVQPVVRRFVPAPYDGVLEDVTVEPGDVVREGQVLARMDHREIDWELAATQAEYQRARKQHDVSLATGLTADAQIAKLEMERLDVEIQLLRDRIQNLEIRSPIDGVVISGDPGKRRGARLTQGETLFEAGPLDRMLVEIYVPDREVSHVAEGQAARVRLDAFAGRVFEGPVLRIGPSAIPHEQSNVFVAEIELDNPQQLLRPGMSGDGRIQTGYRALGWVLFHKAWQSIVSMLG